MGGISSVTATIAATTSLSSLVDLQGGTVVAIGFPAAWDAAQLSFQVSTDAINFNNLFDDGNVEVLIGAAAAVFAGKTVAFRASVSATVGYAGIFDGHRYIKVRSGTSAAPVNQTATRVLQIALRMP
jgi:hypothetical protein